MSKPYTMSQIEAELRKMAQGEGKDAESARRALRAFETPREREQRETVTAAMGLRPPRDYIKTTRNFIEFRALPARVARQIERRRP